LRLLMIASKGTIAFTVLGVDEMYHTCTDFCKNSRHPGEHRGIPQQIAMQKTLTRHAAER